MQTLSNPSLSSEMTPSIPPVGLQLRAVRDCPLRNQPECGPRTERTREELPVKRERGLLPLVFRVEMTDTVLPPPFVLTSA